MSLIRHPVVQFLAIGAVLFVLILIGAGQLSDRAAEQEAISDARATTEVLARSVAEPALTAGLVAGSAGAVDRFDRRVLDQVLVGDVRRIKIWDRDGRIVYSDETELIGESFPLEPDQRELLARGGTDAGISDLHRQENRFEADADGLVEVYTRVETPEGVPLLFELYFEAEDLQARKAAIYRPFRRILIGAMLAMLAAATPMIWLLTTRLTQAGRERERLLRAAVDASAAERRRIARDLHDGVVQQLAGTSYSLSAAARTGRPTPVDLAAAWAGSLRECLSGLRAVLVEIHPPRLGAEGLAPALADLAAAGISSGVRTEVEVEGIDGAPEQVVQLIWRVAQEAVRNALRHSGGRRIDVRVRGGHQTWELSVTDDGHGFDPGAARSELHYGLRGMRDMCQEAGGELEVRSAPGQGTTVRLTVPR